MNISSKTSRAWSIVNLVVLSILGGANVFLSLFIVPKFRQIFQDALGPDHPLPGVTLFIINARIPLALLALAWVMVGIVATWKGYRAAVGIVALGDLFFLGVIGISIIALFMPMVGEITGASYDPMTSPAGSH